MCEIKLEDVVKSSTSRGSIIDSPISLSSSYAGNILKLNKEIRQLKKSEKHMKRYKWTHARKR